MPKLTIDGKVCEFEPGQNLLQVALDNDVAIPHYCYHPALSVVANCRICLAEVSAPNPRNENKLELIPKLLPTCQTMAAEGQVVSTTSPKSIANQRAVMELLLINHPVDCPVCDQAGECTLQDYSYRYGRGVSRFEEQKIKQPKKDIGPHVLLYMDRCIMCTRCVRFTREVTGTAELTIEGRGADAQIDIFPGFALENELSANVIDLCPVGALLDKDFLFQQRVWLLSKTPSIDPLTCSGDNISIEHNLGQVYRVKPRPNPEVNRWWITDEVRYGWKFIHAEERLRMPMVKGEDAFEEIEAPLAWEKACARLDAALVAAAHVGLLISPMLSCEDAYLLASYVMERDESAAIGIGPVPVDGADKTFPDGFTMYAEKAPNARGVRRVLERFTANVLDFDAFTGRLRSDSSIDAVLLTGNYPSDWVTGPLLDAVGASERFVGLIDTLPTALTEEADVVLPGATWAEKSGTFENVKHRLQAFERAIDPIDYCKSEAQIALDLMAIVHDAPAPAIYNPANTRAEMTESHDLEAMVNQVHLPDIASGVESDMDLIEI